jgi:type IV pilus assembly protein PilV
MAQHLTFPSRRQPAARLRNPAQRSHSAGFSLMEVLVSIVVLTIGILGMVGMQAAALQSNREAKLQSSAVVFARELADMIRGNKVMGVLPVATNPYVGAFASPLTPTVANYCMSVGGNCVNATPTVTNRNIAEAQMTEWLDRVNTDLPGARVVVCIDTTPYDANGRPRWICDNVVGGQLVIKIGWTKTSTDKTTEGAAALDRAGDLNSVPSVILPVTAGSSI